jgi:hypothetical protein
MSARKQKLTSKIIHWLTDLFFAGQAPLDKRSQAIADKNDAEVAKVRVPLADI